MSGWLAWRVVKHVGVALLFAGVLGAATLRAPEERQRAVYAVATPAFFAVWVAGYGLLRAQGISMGAPWISAGLLASLAAFALAAWSVERDGRQGAAWASLAVLVGTVVLMVVKPGGAP